MTNSKVINFRTQPTPRRKGHRWQVPLSEIKEALDSEIVFFQKRLDACETASQSFNALTQGSHNENKAMLSPEDIAALSAASRGQLHEAERALYSAKSKIEQLSVEIADHNHSLATQGLFRSLLLFFKNRRKANELQQRRARTVRQHRAAEQKLEALIVSIRRQEEENLHSFNDGTNMDSKLQQLYRHRQLAILRNYQQTELSIRQDLREDMQDLNDRERLHVFHQNLDEAVTDQRLQSQIRWMKRRRKSRFI